MLTSAACHTFCCAMSRPGKRLVASLNGVQAFAWLPRPYPRRSLTHNPVLGAGRATSARRRLLSLRKVSTQCAGLCRRAAGSICELNTSKIRCVRAGRRRCRRPQLPLPALVKRGRNSPGQVLVVMRQLITIAMSFFPLPLHLLHSSSIWLPTRKHDPYRKDATMYGARPVPQHSPQQRRSLLTLLLLCM